MTTPTLRPLPNKNHPAITTTIYRYKMFFNRNSMVVCSKITTTPLFT